jgi:Flp pilus assembly protein TadB
MTTQPSGRGRRWLEKTELILAHLAAVAMGFVLMVVGLGLGVTMIMLPVGLVVGLLGVMLFVWGLLGHLGNDR